MENIEKDGIAHPVLANCTLPITGKFDSFQFLYSALV
jgi:hypothetical protein